MACASASAAGAESKTCVKVTGPSFRTSIQPSSVCMTSYSRLTSGVTQQAEKGVIAPFCGAIGMPNERRPIAFQRVPASQLRIQNCNHKQQN